MFLDCFPECKELFNKANYWRCSEKGATPKNFPGLAKEKETAAGPAAVEFPGLTGVPSACRRRAG